MDRRANVLSLIIVSAVAFCASAASAVTLDLPRGTQQVTSESTPLDSYALPVGRYGPDGLPVDLFEGAVTRTAFQLDNDSITLLQMLQPLRDGLLRDGFTIRLDCDETTCGGFDFRFATEVLPSPAMYVDLTAFRFLSAQRDDTAIGILISRAPGKRFLQVIDVAPEATQRPEIAPTDAAPNAHAPRLRPSSGQPPPPQGPALSTALQDMGRVVLDDLTFETGRTALSAGPYASLEALARFLLDRPEARVTLVGHTDAVGGLDSNIAISRARAEAVRDRLVQSYDVPVTQLGAEGIGFLSPRSGNLSEDGRARNRRVEAVLTRLD